jgi:hypothetical protein
VVNASECGFGARGIVQARLAWSLCPGLTACTAATPTLQEEGAFWAGRSGRSESRVSGVDRAVWTGSGRQGRVDWVGPAGPCGLGRAGRAVRTGGSEPVRVRAGRVRICRARPAYAGPGEKSQGLAGGAKN